MTACTHIYLLSSGLTGVTGVCQLCGEEMPDWKASNADKRAFGSRKKGWTSGMPGQVPAGKRDWRGKAMTVKG